MYFSSKLIIEIQSNSVLESVCTLWWEINYWMQNYVLGNLAYWTMKICIIPMTRLQSFALWSCFPYDFSRSLQDIWKLNHHRILHLKSLFWWHESNCFYFYLGWYHAHNTTVNPTGQFALPVGHHGEQPVRGHRENWLVTWYCVHPYILGVDIYPQPASTRWVLSSVIASTELWNFPW